MFGIGETELVLILLFAFMIFGPDKLPGMGKTLGRALRQFRTAQEGFTQVVQTEIVDPATEAMSDKKPNRNRAEFDEDADIEGEGASAPAAKKTETFAERKKRLEAERKAKEAAEKEAAEAAEQSSAAADPDADEAPAAETPAPTSEAEPAAPKKPSVADLYTMKRPAPEPAAEPQPEAGVSAGESLDASREASDERSEERRAGEALPAAGAGPSADAAAADTTEKEA